MVAASKAKSKTKSKSKKATLDSCLNHLHNPDMDNQPPLQCYKLLEFPKEPRNTLIKPGPNYEYLVKLHSKNTVIGPKLTVDPNNLKIYVPPKFRDKLKKLIQRYVIIPIHFKSSSNTYAILMDKNMVEFQIFLPPGNKKIKNHSKLELKLRSLFTKRLNIPTIFFYHTITYTPPNDSLHADFWPSWIIHKRIQKAEDRERLVNSALEKILKGDPTYKKFIKDFTKYLIK